MESAKQVKVPPRIWVLRGWLVILALAEIAFGLFPFWGSVNWGGDYIAAAFILFFIAFIGVISLISGILLFLRYKWALDINTFMLILIILILIQDIAIWLGHRGGVSSIFQHTFGFQTNFSDQLMGTLIISSLVGTLIWMFIDRKKFWHKDQGQIERKMENTGRTHNPLRVKILRRWVIILALLEMVFGLYPLWGGGNLGGDWMGVAFLLFFIFLMGLATLISGILVLRKKKGAWYLYILLLILLIFILSLNLLAWLGRQGGTMNIFERIFGYQADTGDIVSATLMMVALLGTMVWLVIDRKKLLQE